MLQRKFEAAAAFVLLAALYAGTASARFIEEDPVGLEAGTNLYAYVNNNPIPNVDPMGLMGRAPGRGPYPPGQGPGTLPWPYNNWYGNGCGPGGSGTPINAIDTACMGHDACYDACGVRAGTRWSPSNFGSSCPSACDSQFASAVRACF